MDSYSLELKLRIDWSEIDLFGHVNNLAVMKYVQSARVCYLEGIGLMQSQAETRMGPILASTSCQFRKPLFYPGQVTVRSGVDYIKNTSFRIQHLICDDKNEVAAEAQDILVFFDYCRNVKLGIPKEIRDRIEKLENRKL